MTLERGNTSTAVASATLMWPTGIAAGAGVVSGGLSFLLALPAITLTSPLTTAIFFFSLVGGGVALLSSKGDRRARRYAGQYPWRFAMVPAGLGAGGVALVTFIGVLLSGNLLGALFAAVGMGLAAGAVLWVVLGIIGMVAGNKAS